MEQSTTPDVVKAILERSDKDYTHWVPMYTLAVSVLGLSVLTIAFLNLPSNASGFIPFATMAALTTLFGVQLFRRSRSSTFFVEAIILASITLFGPWYSVMISAITSIVSIVSDMFIYKEILEGRAAWWQRGSFNSGMHILSTVMAGMVFLLSGGVISSVIQTSNILPLILAGLTYHVVNLGIVLGVLTLQTGKHIAELWKQDHQWYVPASIASSVIGGGLIALTYQTSFFASVSVVALITTLSYFYSRHYVSNMKEHVENLEAANTRLDDFNMNMFMTMSALIDAYDAYTFGHSAQVTVYAEAIAEELGLKQDQIDVIVRGALVHDIGKVGVMDSIIGKQGRLTDEEYNLVKRHPDIGAEILSRAKTDEMEEIIPLVRFHHERWDGSGYPLGISGETIPLGARILAVADSVDAMLSDRPYRTPPTFDEVKEEVLRCMGTQFDPSVVHAFFAVANEKGPNFFKNSAEAVDKKYRPENLTFVTENSRYLKKSMLWHSGDRSFDD